MDDLENKGPGQSDELTQLRGDYEALRQLVLSLLILLLVVSGTFNIYLLRQAKYTKRDLDNYRPYATNLIAGYQKSDGPAIEAFMRNIMEYGRTNKEFGQILNNKYGIRAMSANGAALPAGAPAPGPTPVVPKK